MKISVCMATYNGAQYLQTQLKSIMNQLSTSDEVIIVDDNSSDGTITNIEAFNDPRIKLFKNEANEGFVFTFERALRMASGNLIFLSDQDDQWCDNKISEITRIFESGKVDLIVHNATINDNGIVNPLSLFEYRNTSKGVIKNIISNTYIGCCMAFRKEILRHILPIPRNNAIYHDAWIGILANCLHYNITLDNKKLITFMRHTNNVSTLKSRSLLLILKDRFIFISALIYRLLKVFFIRRY